MNLLRRAMFLRNMSGGLVPAAGTEPNLTAFIVIGESDVAFSEAVWSLTGTIAARGTNSTSGFTDIGSFTLEMGSTYGTIDQTQPVFHPSNSSLVRLYRSTNGYLEMKLGFIWAGQTANFITNYGTGGFVRYLNRTRGPNLTQNFLTETVGNAANTIRYTKVGNLNQTNEVVGDVVRLEFYYTGG